MPNGNRKIAFISPATANKWFLISNLFAKSLLSRSEAIQEYNKLSVSHKREIKSRISSFDATRGQILLDDLTQQEKDHHYMISVLVDSHIVATEFDTDPVAVLMCLQPPCKLSQKVFVK